MFQENLEQPVSAPTSSRDTNKENFDLYIQNLSNEEAEIQMKQQEFDDKTILLNEEASFTIKSHHEYTVAYSKLWKSLRDAMPSTYGNLAWSPAEILCAAINCIQVLKGMQEEREFQKVTVDIKTSLHSEDKSSPIIWNYHTFIAAYYELWNLVRSTMPSTYKSLIFLPPKIFCGAVDCIQMLKTKKEDEFKKNTVNLMTLDEFLDTSLLIVRSFQEYAEAFYKLWKLLRIDMPHTYKFFNDSTSNYLQTIFSPSQILCEAIDCIQVLKSMQDVAVTASIKISSYSEGKSYFLMWKYHEYIDAYYEVWNLLRDTMPITFGKLIFSPLHILYGAIDCIQELKAKQRLEFLEITADIKTTLYSEDPIMEKCHKRLDDYYELWKMIKRTMPIHYQNLRFVPSDIDHAAADLAKRGIEIHQITKKDKTD